MNHFELINRLYKEQILPREDFIRLIEHRTAEDADYLASLARKEAQKIYGTGVFPRGSLNLPTTAKMTVSTAASAVPTQMSAVTV